MEWVLGLLAAQKAEGNSKNVEVGCGYEEEKEKEMIKLCTIN